MPPLSSESPRRWSEATSGSELLERLVSQKSVLGCRLDVMDGACGRREAKTLCDVYSSYNEFLSLSIFVHLYTGHYIH